MEGSGSEKHENHEACVSNHKFTWKKTLKETHFRLGIEVRTEPGEQFAVERIDQFSKVYSSGEILVLKALEHCNIAPNYYLCSERNILLSRLAASLYLLVNS